MDVGCYPVNAARMLAGPVGAATATARWQEVDLTLAGVLDHTGGALSLVSCSLASGRHDVLQVVGSDGVIDVPLAFTPPKDQPSMLLVTRGTDTERQTLRAGRPVHAGGRGVRRSRRGRSRHRPAADAAGRVLDNASTIDALLASAR